MSRKRTDAQGLGWKHNISNSRGGRGRNVDRPHPAILYQSQEIAGQDLALATQASRFGEQEGIQYPAEEGTHTQIKRMKHKQDGLHLPPRGGLGGATIVRRESPNDSRPSIVGVGRGAGRVGGGSPMGLS